MRVETREVDLAKTRSRLSENQRGPVGTVPPRPDGDQVRQFWEATGQVSPTFLTRNPGKSYFLEPMMDKAQAIFEQVATRPLRILEIGCGDGHDASMLSAPGHKVYGIDVAFSRLQRALSNTQKLNLADRARFVESRAEVIPFQNGSFDLVYSNSVLLWVDVDSVLRECHRVLRPGGKALFVGESLPNHPLIWLARQMAPIKGKREMERLVDRIDPCEIKKKYSGLYSNIEHHEFFLIAPFSLAVRKLRERWKLLGGKPSLTSYRRWHHLDRLLLSRFASLRRFCWLAIIDCTK